MVKNSVLLGFLRAGFTDLRSSFLGFGKHALVSFSLSPKVPEAVYHLQIQVTTPPSGFDLSHSASCILEGPLWPHC